MKTLHRGEDGIRRVITDKAWRRLERGLQAAEKMLFTPAGNRRTLIRSRPRGAAKLTKCKMTSKGIAGEFAIAFRDSMNISRQNVSTARQHSTNSAAENIFFGMFG